ncbi:GntR family transcriptional regulator [Geothrix limicola]|uniref:GntR family transcriptional regulator n=1 Tax=Geothrix limicola TaxID=2927978 RepID=A0ABQ5QFW5_9BACT|nr:PLP-dependent aminotransferase family protein [Geothrix limicola]GLH73458.1 GntR family transcriptional regulator [Geothrix limicola]
MTNALSNSMLEPEMASPLYIQLRRRIRTLIQQGLWKPESQLPTVSELARHHGVNRLTVLKALAGLKHAGWVQTFNGRGTFVASKLPEFQGGKTANHHPFEGSSATVRKGAVGSWICETLEQPQDCELLNFSAETAPPDLLPHDALRSMTRQALRELGPELWQYSEPAGFAPYLEAVGRWLASQGEPVEEGWGIRAIPGAQAGLALTLETFTVPGDRVLVESPGQAGLLALVRALGREAVPMPLDQHGVDPDRLESILKYVDAKVLFTVPTFQNPTGTIQPRGRRERILALTRARGVLVVEDSTYADLRFSGLHHPSNRQLDGSDHVIQLGSFSKSLAAGLRLGYLIAKEPLLRRMAPIQESQAIALAPLTQAVVARFLDSGGFRRHVGRLRRTIKARKEAMIEAVVTHFPPDTQISEPKGGLHLWVVLPEDCSAVDLQAKALKRGISFAPGPLFFPDGRGTNCLRLNVSTCDPATTRRAIEHLGRLIR